MPAFKRVKAIPTKVPLVDKKKNDRIMQITRQKWKFSRKEVVAFDYPPLN